MLYFWRVTCVSVLLFINLTTRFILQMDFRKWLLVGALCFVFNIVCKAQSDTHVISGYVTDASTGEVLPGAAIVVNETGSGTVSNVYGYFSLTLKSGSYSLTSAYLGYEPLTVNVLLDANLRINLALKPESQRLSEIEIRGLSRDEQRRVPVMGVEKLDAATISRIPVLFGETDPLKALQLLPGISATSEGSSGFSVRGGNPDQNLLLFDEAIVYNGGHLLGFFSIFNNDAIKEVQVFKGDLPATAGGRLSSLVDIRSRDGNMHRFSGVAGLGLISSRLTLEGPVVKEQSSFLVSARRTYLDAFLPLASDENVRDNRLYFYDVNMKFNIIAGENDRLFFSTYLGRDVFRNDIARFDFGNRALSLRWNHLFSNRLFSNLTVVTSRYDYALGTGGEEFQSIQWNSVLDDYSMKYDFTWFPNSSHQVEFGIQSIFHAIRPGHVVSREDNATLNEIRIPSVNSLEHGLYASDTWQFAPRWSLRYGLRFSLFQNIGKGEVYSFDANYNVLDTTFYRSGEIFNTYGGLEPRLGLSWLLSPVFTLKGSYSLTRQYLHLASNSTSATPLDVWFTSSPNIKPQIANQFSLGVFYKSQNNLWDHSLEVFHKKTSNAIDFKDHPNLLLNKAIEGEIRPGRAYARGIEWLSKYNGRKLSGWFSYTLSKAERESKWINGGKPYLSPYDHTHDISIVVSYNLNSRINFGSNWVYFTGTPVTWPVGRFDFLGSVIPYYSERNAERMPDYHRMDVSVSLKNKPKPERVWNSEWVFSLYNLYGRRNAWIINFVGEDDIDPYYREAEKTYLFSIVPSVSYMIRF